MDSIITGSVSQLGSASQLGVPYYSNCARDAGMLYPFFSAQRCMVWRQGD